MATPTRELATSTIRVIKALRGVGGGGRRGPDASKRPHISNKA